MDLLKSVDIALGMIVVYLTFALGVTATNEALAAALSSRAKWLRRGIAALLTPPGGNAAAPEANADAFYNSAFVSHLGRAAGWAPRFAPSYVPRWTMLQAMLDTAQEKKGQALDTLQAIRAAAERLPENSPARVAVLDMLGSAVENLERFRTLADEWLAGFESQLSAWYRRKTQAILLLISAFVVTAANLDTVALVKQLAVDTKARNALVQTALEQAGKEGLAALTDPAGAKAAQRKLDELKRADTVHPDEMATAEATLAAEQAKADLVAQLTTDGLRLGWQRAVVQSMGFYDWVLKIFGLLLSTAALSMGAPFWFDLLQKVASVRSVGLNLAEQAKRKEDAARAEAAKK